MSFSSVHLEYVSVTLGGLSDVSVGITIEPSYKTTISFLYGGRPYLFRVNNWTGAGMDRFLELFDEASEDKDSLYATTIQACKEITDLRSRVILAIVQACRDIMELLNRILLAHGHNALSYAMWYRQNHRDESTYYKYIARRTCKCISRTNFLAPNLTYDAVIE